MEHRQVSSKNVKSRTLTPELEREIGLNLIDSKIHVYVCITSKYHTEPPQYAELCVTKDGRKFGQILHQRKYKDGEYV